MTAVFGTPVLRTLVLFGWLAGFTVVPEALAAPYARDLGGGAPAIGLLMAAMPAGTVIGGFVIGRLLRPSDRMRPMGWLAMLSCAPLIFSLAHPPLPVLILLLALAGAGGAYQLAAAAAFVTALPAGRRIRAFAVAQTGLLAAQGLGIVTGGAVAQRVGAPGAVALAGLMGLLAAAALATDWGRLARGADQHGEKRAGRRRARRDRHRRRAANPGTHSPGTHGPGTHRQQPAQQPARTASSPHRSQPAPPPRPAGPDRALARGSRRASAHRAPHELPLRARLAATRLLDQVLGDRRTLAFLWDDDPRSEVHQREDAGRHQSEGDEDHADHGGVDAGVLADPGADPSQEPIFPCPD